VVRRSATVAALCAVAAVVESAATAAEAAASMGSMAPEAAGQAVTAATAWAAAAAAAATVIEGGAPGASSPAGSHGRPLAERERGWHGGSAALVVVEGGVGWLVGGLGVVSLSQWYLAYARAPSSAVQ